VLEKNKHYKQSKQLKQFKQVNSIDNDTLTKYSKIVEVNNYLKTNLINTINKNKNLNNNTNMLINRNRNRNVLREGEEKKEEKQSDKIEFKALKANIDKDDKAEEKDND